MIPSAKVGTAIPFALVVAFSRDPSGGNPAAVVFMDLTQPDEVYQGIAKNLNQPMTAFVKAKEIVKSRTAAFSIRFLSAHNEFPLCGHATLATASVIFKDPSITSDIDVLEFEARDGKVLSARKLDDGSLELRFPSGMPEEVSGRERARLVPHINKAFDREVAIHYIGTDSKNGSFGNCKIYPVAQKLRKLNHPNIVLMVEIDAKEDLKNSVVDVNALVRTLVPS
jgi:predicted PhzF superfamily epimerase YddE/YHI9